jgi:hypothetical protein
MSPRSCSSRDFYQNFHAGAKNFSRERLKDISKSTNGLNQRFQHLFLISGKILMAMNSSGRIWFFFRPLMTAVYTQIKEAGGED